MNNYKIEFRGLSEGKHHYSFELNDDFFEQYVGSEIQKGTVFFEIEMLINKDLISLNISLKGKVFVPCDRCTEYFYQTIKFNTKLFVEFGFENSDLSDVYDKIILSTKENEIVLDKHFYDYIYLSLPYKKIHPKDKSGNSDCNLEILKKIEELSINNESDETDPRWDKLKNLYN